MCTWLSTCILYTYLPTLNHTDTNLQCVDAHLTSAKNEDQCPVEKTGVYLWRQQQGRFYWLQVLHTNFHCLSNNSILCYLKTEPKNIDLHGFDVESSSCLSEILEGFQHPENGAQTNFKENCKEKREIPEQKFPSDQTFKKIKPPNRLPTSAPCWPQS